MRACFQPVALLGTILYTAALAKQHSDATSTSTTSLPLTILCPWDYPPVYIGINRRSQWSGSWGGVTYYVCGIFPVPVAYQFLMAMGVLIVF